MTESVETPALEELADYKQWVMWKAVDGKKRPFSHKGAPIGATIKYEDKWSYYDDVKKEFEEQKHLPKDTHGGWDGIGFVFSEDDPFVGVDIDKCRDPETGSLTDNAKAIVKELASYTEESPSGTGVHIICRGDHLVSGHNPRGKDPVEMYSWGRYFTFNGKHITSSPATIEDRHDALKKLEARLYKTSQVVAESEWKGVDFQLAALAKAPPEKLKELLTSLDFKKTWNHTRTDVADKSMSEMDAACARFMVDAGWEPHEVAAGIIEHRNRWCKDKAGLKKAMRVDYIGRTWAWAKKCSEEGIDEDEFLIKQAIEQSGGDAALHEVSNRMGVMVTRVIKMGDVPRDYFIRVNGQEVKLGSAAAARSQKLVADAVWDVTGLQIKRMKASKWDQVVGLIGAAAEYREAPGSGRVGEMEEIVSQYVEARDVDTTAIEHAFYQNLPFKEGGFLYIHKGNLIAYMNGRTTMRLKPAEVTKILIEAGWQPHAKTMRVEETPTCRQLLRKPC